MQPCSLELKLGDRTYETNRLSGVFGALRDSSPDYWYWCRRLIEKHSGEPLQGELDYSLDSPDDRAGALGFGLGNNAPVPKRKFNQTIDLALPTHSFERKLVTTSGVAIVPGKCSLDAFMHLFELGVVGQEKSSPYCR